MDEETITIRLIVEGASSNPIMRIEWKGKTMRYCEGKVQAPATHFYVVLRTTPTTIAFPNLLSLSHSLGHSPQCREATEVKDNSQIGCTKRAQA